MCDVDSVLSCINNVIFVFEGFCANSLAVSSNPVSFSQWQVRLHESQLLGSCWTMKTSKEKQHKRFRVENNTYLVGDTLVSGGEARAQREQEHRPEREQQLESPRDLLTHVLRFVNVWRRKKKKSSDRQKFSDARVQLLSPWTTCCCCFGGSGGASPLLVGSSDSGQTRRREVWDVMKMRTSVERWPARCPCPAPAPPAATVSPCVGSSPAAAPAAASSPSSLPHKQTTEL